MTGALKSMWAATELTAGQLAVAIECTEQAAEELLSLMAPSRKSIGVQKVGLAVASALHRQAGIELPVAIAIVRGSRRLCESVLTTLDFFPPVRGDEQTIERDPFMLFAPHAVDGAAVPAIDHYIDLVDGRRIGWRRPRHDPYRLACELHRLSSAVKSDDTPALQEQYLELLAGLRGPVAQDSEWIGSVRHGRFRPAPERFAEPSPTMRQGPAIETDATWSANVYGTCVSVNVSLAARCFKRRMLGLEVNDPFAPPSRTKTKREQTRVPE